MGDVIIILFCGELLSVFQKYVFQAKILFIIYIPESVFKYRMFYYLLSLLTLIYCGRMYGYDFDSVFFK